MLQQIDLSRIDLNLLVLFEVINEERQVARAAQRLRLSPSAVSHGLGRLRAQLNDPLFLKTPKGVSPTDRALSLAAPIAEILSRVRNVVATATPFDPATSTRRFIIGSPDGSAIVPLAALLRELATHAPGIDIGTRQIMPNSSAGRPWEAVYRALDEHSVDIAAVTFGDIPPRFVSRPLYRERFVVAVRKGHPFLADPSLTAYCAAHHVVVSTTADPATVLGDRLAEKGLSRRVLLTVPHFIVALATIAETDLIGTVPESLVRAYADRLGLVAAPAPFEQGGSDVQLVVPRVSLMDAGLAWLVGRIEVLAG